MRSGGRVSSRSGVCAIERLIEPSAGGVPPWLEARSCRRTAIHSLSAREETSNRMPLLPESPIPAAEFFERFLPRAFAEGGLPDALRGVDATFGVCLEGAGGGEWLVELRGGRLRVKSDTREGAAVTLVQSVADWRGALWE